MSRFVAGLLLAAGILAPAISTADPLPCQDQGLGAHCDETYNSEFNTCGLLPGASSDEVQECRNQARFKRDECKANANTCNF